MEALFQWFENLSSQGYLVRVIETAIVILLYVLCRAGLAKGSQKAISNPDKRFRLLKFVGYFLKILLLLALFELWFSEDWSLASFVGLLSAGLAFILREPLLNLAGWIFIVTRQPFNLGDRIELGDWRGDVVDIGLNDFTLMEIGNWVEADQSTGRIVHVPNGLIFTQGLSNYHRGFPFLWHELPIVLTYESDWPKARTILQEIAEHQNELNREEREKVLAELQEQNKYLISFKHLTPIVYLSKSDDGICLTLRYLCDPRRRRSTENDLWVSIFERFQAEEGIRFAYTTRRITGATAETP